MPTHEAKRWAPGARSLTAAAWEALGTVLDPELDEPVTELGFVSRCEVDDAGEAVVRLRLPTYFCAPNFAFLMVADAHDAVSAVLGVVRVDVALDDHFASEAINTGVAAHSGFADTFDGYAEDELEELRATFLRKALLASQDRIARPLLAAGLRVDQLLDMTLGTAPPSEHLDRLRARRAQLGISADDDAPLLVDDTGQAVDQDALPLHLRRAKLTRVSIDANSGFCRDQLAARYGTGTPAGA